MMVKLMSDLNAWSQIDPWANLDVKGRVIAIASGEMDVEVMRRERGRERMIASAEMYV